MGSNTYGIGPLIIGHDHEDVGPGRRQGSTIREHPDEPQGQQKDLQRKQRMCSDMYSLRRGVAYKQIRHRFFIRSPQVYISSFLIGTGRDKRGSPARVVTGMLETFCMIRAHHILYRGDEVIQRGKARQRLCPLHSYGHCCHLACSDHGLHRGASCCVAAVVLSRPRQGKRIWLTLLTPERESLDPTPPAYVSL